jgi:outer membrane protein TolC
MFKNSFSHEISVNQPISNGGVEIIAIKIARETKKAVEFQLQAIRQEAVFNTRTAYFEGLKAVETAAIAEKSLTFAQRNLARAKTRHQTGDVPITDVLQWEAEVTKRQSDLTQAEAHAKFMMLNLYQNMGVPLEDTDLSVQLDPVSIYEQWYDKGLAATQEDITNNPRLLSLKFFTQASRGYEKAALTRFFPKLNAFYKYSWPGWDKVQPWQERRGWTAGATLTIPIFSGFKNSTHYRKTKYEYKKNEVEEKKVENQLKINLERIKLFYRAAFKAVAGARKQLELMEKQLAIMQKRYDGGLVNQLQLLETALGADQAKINYLQKLFECLLLESEYKKEIGKLEIHS